MKGIARRIKVIIWFCPPRDDIGEFVDITQENIEMNENAPLLNQARKFNLAE